MSSIETVLPKTQLVITQYVLPVCCILGIFGNVCNLGIFIQKHLRVNSCSIYFLAGSLVNLFIIIFGVLPTISALYIPDPSLYLSWACKLKLYGLHSLLMMSRSYIVLACIDQYASCSTNARIRQFSRRQVALRIVPVVPIIWVLVPIHMLVFVDIQIINVRCGTSGTYSLVYSIYSFLVSSLPLMLMVSFSLMTFRSLRQMNQRVLPIINNQTHPGNTRLRKYDHQIMIMLICQVIVYLISNILHPTNTLYMSLTAVPKGSPPKTALRLLIEGFITYLTWGFLIYLNSCSTFYINFCVSNVFRARFYYLIKWICNGIRYGRGVREQFQVNATGISATFRLTRRQATVAH